MDPSTATLDRLLAACGLELPVLLVPRHTDLDAALRAALALPAAQRLQQVERRVAWLVDDLAYKGVDFIVEGPTAAALHGAPGRVVSHAIAIPREYATVERFYQAAVSLTDWLEAIDLHGRNRRGVHPIDIILDEERPLFEISGTLLEIRRPEEPDAVDCMDVNAKVVLVRGLDALCADPPHHGVDSTVVRRIQALSEVTR